MVSAVLYLLEIFLFPAVVAVALSYITVRESNRQLRSKMTSAIVESDLRNENMDPSITNLGFWLAFSIYFNLVYLTVNITVVEKTMFNSPYIYAACLGAFMISAYLALLFIFRFDDRRFAITGISFSVVGTAVVMATIQLGFGHWTAYASSASTGATIAGQAQSLVVPIVMAVVAWVITLVSFLLDYGIVEDPLPFRFPKSSGYNTMLAAVALGYIGIVLSILYPLYRLI